jgi:hypothetical protein
MTQDEIIDMWHAANGVKIKGAEYDVVATFAQLVARRAWVGLTDEEMNNIRWDWVDSGGDYTDFARAIEAKLKERNT